MTDFGIFLINAIVMLFAFFAAAPLLLSAVSAFGVQKSFAGVMVEEGIIKEEDVKMLLPKKQIAGVVISLLVLAVLFITANKAAPYGFICAGVGLVGGALKYRRILQFNSLTVKRFQTTFRGSYDAKKLNVYVDKHF